MKGQDDFPAPDDGLDRIFCRRFENGAWRDFTDTMSPEVGVRIYWPATEPVDLWAHPDRLEELVLGHALVELCRPGDVPVLEEAEGASFHLAPGPAPAPTMAPPPRVVAPEEVILAMDRFLAADGRWDATGCFHRAGFLEPYSGQFLKFAEDIGRHNCIDRLAGWALMEGVAPSSGIVFLSARITASMAAKLAAAGFRAVVSRSAVTTAGMDIARRRRMTLAGFARPGRFTVFTDSQGRIRDPEAQAEARGA